MSGKLSKEILATPEIEMLCESVKSSAEKQAGKDFDVFQAKTYKTLVESGTTYFIKVNVGGDDYVHLRVSKKTDGSTTLEKMLHSMGPDESIEYF